MLRTLRRFFVDAPLSREDTRVELSSRETYHLQRVLRLKVGDHCQIFSRTGQRAQATIQSISKGGRALLQLDELFSSPETSLRLKVGQALPQKRKMDVLVDWASELGIQELWVMETERTIVKMKGEARERARRRCLSEGAAMSPQTGRSRQDVGGISTTRPSCSPKSHTSMAGGSTPSVVRPVQIWLR